MSDRAVSALEGEAFEGYATVADAGLRGMVTLRADLSAAKVKAAVRKVAGVDPPGRRRIALKGGKGAGWMSPDYGSTCAFRLHSSGSRSAVTTPD